MNISIVFTGTIVLTITAFILAIAVSLITQYFYVAVDPKIEQIHEILPHFNCGACGYAGCMPYAQSIINDGEITTKCRPGGEKVAEKIVALLEKSK